MRRGMSSTVVIAVLTVVAALALLAWGSSNGSPLVTSPQGTWGPPPLTAPERSEPPEDVEEQTSPPPSEEAPGPNIYQWLVDAIQLLVLLAVVTALLLMLRAALSRELEDRTPPALEEDELSALLDASGEEVRYRALAEGDPRNAVVACWVALEEAVHRSGLDEDRSRTAAELTTTVLRRWQVDPAAIRSLSAAYREARFSRHAVTEEQRVAAVDALEAIHADLLARRRAEESALAASDPEPPRGPGATS